MPDPLQRIYLDYNATAPVLPEVSAAIGEVLGITGNPSSVHQDGRKVRALIEDARDSVAALVQCNPEAVTFTSGGTEANAMAIQGLLGAQAVSTVLCSSVEHPSVLENVEPLYHLPVDHNGVLDLSALEKALQSNPTPVLVCIMFANNETGVIQPVKLVSDLVHSYGGLVLCDAVQAPGKAPLDMKELDADFLTLSAHKIGGTQGVGALINREGVDLRPLFPGGGQEKKRRPGTENSPGIIGFGIAAKIAGERDTTLRVEEMRNRLEDALMKARPDAVISGQGTKRLPNTTNIAIPGMSSERQVINLDLAGFSITSGSACSSGKMAKSHVLLAMGVDSELVESAIRISISHDTQWQELEKFVAVWASL